MVPWDKPVRSGNSVLRKITEGWTINGIASFQSGNPFTVYSNNNSSELDNYLDRPNVTGPIQIFSNPRSIQTLNGDCGGGEGRFYFSPANLLCTPSVDPQGSDGGVPLFSHGNMGRNVLRGPGINNWDLSFLKAIKFTETKSLEFRAEMFNAFNHVQFYNPDANGYSGTFGQVTSDRGARVMQFALKLYF
jgi:hypothetical protein